MSFDASALSPDILKNVLAAVTAGGGASAGGLGSLLSGAKALSGLLGGGAGGAGDLLAKVAPALQKVLGGNGLTDLAKNIFMNRVFDGAAAAAVAKRFSVSESEVGSTVAQVVGLLRKEILG